MRRHSKTQKRHRRKQRRARSRRQRGGNDTCIFVNWGPGLGLGNQLFIYTAGLVIKNMTGKKLCVFPQVGNMHSEKDYRPLLNHAVSVDRTPEMLERLDEATKIHARKEVQQGPWNTNDIPNVTGDLRLKDSKTPGYEGGYYQNYASLQSAFPQVRTEFVGQLKNLYGDLHIKPKAAFMQVRRGDLIGFKEDVKPDYLRAALVELDKVPEIETLYCIAHPTEIQWCKSQDFKTSKTLEWFDDPDELKAMYLMSQCTAGAIISPSSFSVWGAILGPDANPSSTIIYPKVWSPNMPHINMMFPTRWIGI